MSPTPFTIDVPQEKLDRVLQRVREFPWPAEKVDSGWALGPDPDWLRDFCRYWIEEYDWRGVEARLNELPHFKADADGLALHYVHCRSPRPDATPLLLVHGWPGSFIEFEEMIGPLSDPAPTARRRPRPSMSSLRRCRATPFPKSPPARSARGAWPGTSPP